MSQNTVDTRHLARLITLQKLFERQFRKNDISQSSANEFTNTELADLIAEQSKSENQYDKKLADQLLKGVIQYQEKIDYIIKELAPEWPIEQINKTDLQILRIAVFEGFISQITPEKVAINEAIDLGKEFAGQASGNFINGVLGNLLQNRSKFEQALKA